MAEYELLKKRKYAHYTISQHENNGVPLGLRIEFEPTTHGEVTSKLRALVSNTMLIMVYDLAAGLASLTSLSGLALSRLVYCHPLTFQCAPMRIYSRSVGLTNNRLDQYRPAEVARALWKVVLNPPVGMAVTYPPGWAECAVCHQSLVGFYGDNIDHCSHCNIAWGKNAVHVHDECRCEHCSARGERCPQCFSCHHCGVQAHDR